MYRGRMYNCGAERMGEERMWGQKKCGTFETRLELVNIRFTTHNRAVLVKNHSCMPDN